MKHAAPILILLAFLTFSCIQKEKPRGDKSSAPFSEVTELYSQPEASKMFSKSVSDTFKIFTSLPQNYKGDSVKYPMIILLDANAYMAPLVQELALAQLTLGLPQCVVIGIGYKNFWTLDSLRSRDYTPVEYKDHPGFGGADKFQAFINDELIPSLKTKYSVEDKKIVLLGHSLGGTFVLHYLINSAHNNTRNVSNFVSASPPVNDDEFLLFKKEMDLTDEERKMQFRLYASRGTLELDSPLTKNFFIDFKNQVTSHPYPNSKIEFVEFGNFDHMDAAMPGFVKGLAFIFGEN